MRHDAHGYWIAESGIGDRAPFPALEGDRGCDVAVVGGGYTGMWTAWWLKQLRPEADVVLIEADRCGFGPSGRNAGFVNSMSFSLPALRRCFDDRQALAMLDAAEWSVGEIGRWCEEQGVDAWFNRAGYVQASTSPHFDGKWDQVAEGCEALGVGDRIEILDERATAARCASPVLRGAAFYPCAATVQPARLAAGLRDRIAAAGVEMHERTPMESIEEASPGALLRVPGGTIRAQAVVLGSGGALLELRRLRRALTLTSSHMLITEPAPEILEELNWTGGECVTDARAMVNYFRTTPDGRIAFGWGGGKIVRGARITPGTSVDSGLAAEVERHLRRFFPQFDSVPIAHAWGGPIDVSPTHLPTIRRVGESAFAGFGYTGHGVGPTQLVGRALASLAFGIEDEYSSLPIVDPDTASVPPEPFRHAGGTLIRKAILRKEDAEEQGHKPGPLIRAISGIPERIGIHVGR